MEGVMFYKRICYQLVVKGPDNSQPINQFLIERDLYLELVKNRNAESGLLLGNKNTKPGSAFIEDDYFCFYTIYGRLKKVPIGKTYVKYHDPAKQYQRQDLAFNGVNVIVAKSSIKGPLVPEEWVTLTNGHLLDDLITYNQDSTKVSNQFLVFVVKDEPEFFTVPTLPESTTDVPDGEVPPVDPTDPTDPPVTGPILPVWVMDIDSDGYLRLTASPQNINQCSVSDDGYLTIICK